MPKIKTKPAAPTVTVDLNNPDYRDNHLTIERASSEFAHPIDGYIYRTLRAHIHDAGELSPSWPVLSHCLQENWVSALEMEYFYITNNAARTRLDDNKNGREFIATLKENRSLRSVSLKFSCNVDLLKALSNNPHLEKLNLGGLDTHEITPPLLASLAELIKRTNLETLTLRNMTINDSNFSLVCQALLESSIQEVYLHRLNLSPENLSLLVEVLGRNPRILFVFCDDCEPNLQTALSQVASEKPGIDYDARNYSKWQEWVQNPQTQKELEERQALREQQDLTAREALIPIANERADARLQAIRDSIHERQGKISLGIVSGFIMALGVAAVVTAFIALNLLTGGTAGIVVASLGAAALLAGGIGLFQATRAVNPPVQLPEFIPSAIM